jgi:hemin uptake protein HemP
MNPSNVNAAVEAGLAPAVEAGSRTKPYARRQIASSELLAGGNELQIDHHGEIYTLRQTSKGKLILTK